MTKLTTVSLDNLDNLQIDEMNQLHWMGEELVTIKRLTLPWWGNVCVILAAVATFGSFVIQGMGAANLLPAPPKQIVEVVLKQPEIKAP